MMSVLFKDNNTNPFSLTKLKRNVSGSLVFKSSGKEINLKSGSRYRKTDPQNPLSYDEKTEEISVKEQVGSLTTLPKKSPNLEHIDLEIKNLFRRY